MASKNDKPSVTLLDWQRLEKDSSVYLGQLGDRHSASPVLVDDRGYAVGKARFDDLAKAIRFAERDWAINAPLTELRLRVSELGGKTPRFVWGDDADGLRGSFDGEEIFVKRPTGLTRVVGEVLGYLPFKGNPVFDVEAAKQDRERAWLIARLYGLAAEQAVVAATAAKPAAKTDTVVEDEVGQKKQRARKATPKPAAVKPAKASIKPKPAAAQEPVVAPVAEKKSRAVRTTKTASASSAAPKETKPASDAPSVPKSRARKPAAAKTNAPAVEPAPAETQPKRGPGRPRKDEAAAAKSVATTTAQPPKPTAEATMPASEQAPAKRRPGRPRKTPAQGAPVATKPAPTKPRAPRTKGIGKAESATN